MIIYDFISCNKRLVTFEEALEDETIKSYNDLLRMGLTEQQIKIRGIDLRNIDRDKKVFLVQLPEDLRKSPLLIEEDFHHSYARYLTDKKFIYRVTNIAKAASHLAFYLVKYANTWEEIELWRVNDHDYILDSSMIPQTVVKLRELTIEHIEALYDCATPKRLTVVQS